MSKKSPDPTEQNITGSAKEPEKKKPAEGLSDEELDKASGGMGIIPGRLTENRVADSEVFVKISGPSWVNLMAYRKAGWEAEPKEKRSVVELHNRLVAESADDE
jgi:hypothetical protein